MTGCLPGSVKNSTVCVVSLVLSTSEQEGRRKELGSKKWHLTFTSQALFKILIKIGPISFVLPH
jgi:hypothetical protein